MRLVRHCHRLPREVMDTPTLVVFKATLEKALGNLICWEMSLPMEGGLRLGDL